MQIVINIDDKLISRFKKIFKSKKALLVFTVFVLTSVIVVYASAAAINQLKIFAPGEKIYAEDINNNFELVNDGNTPVGTITAWHKNGAASTLTLNDRWRECNGAVVSDSDSPFNGRAVPNLNGQKRFLRGGTTSGAVQTDAFQGWQGVISGIGDASPTYYSSVRAENAIVTGQNGYSGRALIDFRTVSRGDVSMLKPGNDGTHGAPRVASETRPINMTVVWIIKIK